MDGKPENKEMTEGINNSSVDGDNCKDMGEAMAECQQQTRDNASTDVQIQTEKFSAEFICEKKDKYTLDHTAKQLLYKIFSELKYKDRDRLMFLVNCLKKVFVLSEGKYYPVKVNWLYELVNKSKAPKLPANINNDISIFKILDSINVSQINQSCRTIYVYMIKGQQRAGQNQKIINKTMSSLFKRLASFANYPVSAPQFAIRLAESGFVYIGDGINDKVKCCFCQVVKERWKINDNISNVHRSLNPNCCMNAAENDIGMAQERSSNCKSTFPPNFTDHGPVSTSENITPDHSASGLKLATVDHNSASATTDDRQDMVKEIFSPTNVIVNPQPMHNKKSSVQQYTTHPVEAYDQVDSSSDTKTVVPVLTNVPSEIKDNATVAGVVGDGANSNMVTAVNTGASPSVAEAVSTGPSPFVASGVSEAVNPSVGRGVSNGANSSVARGVSNGANPSVARGVSDGANPSVARGVSNGANRSVARGVSDGANPSVARGVSNGANLSVARGVSNGANRSVARGVSDGANRSVARGVSNGANPSVARGVSDGANPSVARGVSNGANPSVARGVSNGANRSVARGVSDGANRSVARGVSNGANPSVPTAVNTVSKGPRYLEQALLSMRMLSFRIFQTLFCMFSLQETLAKAGFFYDAIASGNEGEERHQEAGRGNAAFGVAATAIDHHLQMSLTRRDMCLICSALDRSVLFENCQHLIMCHKCVKLFTVCPLCSRDITGIITVG